MYINLKRKNILGDLKSFSQWHCDQTFHSLKKCLTFYQKKCLYFSTCKGDKRDRLEPFNPNWIISLSIVTIQLKPSRDSDLWYDSSTWHTWSMHVLAKIWRQPKTQLNPLQLLQAHLVFSKFLHRVSHYVQCVVVRGLFTPSNLLFSVFSKETIQSYETS